MLNIFSYAVLLFVVSVQCQTLNSRACLVGRDGYFIRLMQSVFYRIENEVKWCNLKMDNRGHTVNEELFKWHARGTVNYTDGFAISIEQIDLTDLESSFLTRTINNVMESTWTVRGRVNLRELRVGFDVIANIQDSGNHRFTGAYSHLLVQLQAAITLNINNGTMITSATPISISSGNRRMIYLPHNSITEMLSRSFAASDNRSSFDRWGREIIAPIMLEEAQKVDFPPVNFIGRC